MYNKSRSDDLRCRDRGLAEPHDPKILDLARKMYSSTPASVRHLGGVFTKGVLAQLTVVGLTRYFTKSGCVKRRYVDLFRKNELEPLKRRPKRKCNIVVSLPHANQTWDKASPPERFGEIQTNLFTPGKFENWGFCADKDPSWIPIELKQCCYCVEKGCNCIGVKLRRARPKIVDMRNGMGEGVRATQAYEKGALLGELSGELAPLGYFSDGWAADLMRDDLSPSKELVPRCQVYPRKFGNWVRKVNHSCEPNCVFESKPVSGRWRVLLIAIRRIRRGDWIWVDYGLKYWQSPGAPCLCGSERCVSKSIVNA